MLIRDHVSALSDDERLAIIAEGEVFEATGMLVPGVLLDQVDLLALKISPFPGRLVLVTGLVAAVHRYRSMHQVADGPDHVEYTDLEAENHRLRKILEGKVAELKLVSIENGEIVIGGQIISVLAETMAQMLDDGGRRAPANYTETIVEHSRLGRLILTLQRATGKTPHELRRAAETDRDDVLAALGDLVADHSGPLPQSVVRWRDAALACRPAPKT